MAATLVALGTLSALARQADFLQRREKHATYRHIPRLDYSCQTAGARARS
jgi:hypothetical protein